MTSNENTADNATNYFTPNDGSSGKSIVGQMKLKPREPAKNQTAEAANDRHPVANDEPVPLNTTAAIFWANFGFTVFPLDRITRSPLEEVEPAARQPTAQIVAQFAAHPRDRVGAYVPDGFVAMTTDSAAATRRLNELKTSSWFPPHLSVSPGLSTVLLIGQSERLEASDFKDVTPDGCKFLPTGAVMELPYGSDLTFDRLPATSLAALRSTPTRSAAEESEAPVSPDQTALLDAVDQATSAAVETASAAVVDPESIDPVVLDNPLARYSLLGRADEMEALATEAKPLLGKVALAGQSTIIYARPNTGKTLITLWLVMEAIKAGRVHAANVYYVNADDSSSGVATKVRMFEELGAHTLVPGHRNFKASQLLELMATMAASGKCRGVLIIVDTLKKAVDLMDKTAQRAFGIVVRDCLVGGATFVGLAHTRKNGTPSGKEVYGGTSDMPEDSDATCYLLPLKNSTSGTDNVAQFEFMKRRGNNANEAYAFAADGTESYDELMASVRLVDPENLDELMAEAEQQSDGPVVEAVVAAIRDGFTQKMLLKDEVSKRAKVSKRVAVKVIQRYQGDDPAKHRWTYDVQAKGAKVYRLLEA